MINQERFTEKDIMTANEEHLACVFVFDLSSSMLRKLSSLFGGYRNFIRFLKNDPIAGKCLDVCVVGFNDTAFILQPFTPICKVDENISAQAEGCTNMSAGVDLAIDLIEEQNRRYASNGVPFRKPFLFIITDGLSTSSDSDMQRVGQRIRSKEAAGRRGHLKSFALGVPGYSKADMAKLTDRIMELETADFSSFFNWWSSSLATISHSGIDEHVKFEVLPEDIAIVQTPQLAQHDFNAFDSIV